MTHLSMPPRNTPRKWIRPHYASFNGLRGLAVMMVFCSHYSGSLAKYMGTLWTGVDLFFVLSGFLITGILYDSLHSPHYFRDFYLRRALRIFPVFYGFFLVLLILTPILHLHYHFNMLTFVFYVGNLIVPFTDLARHNPTMITIIRHDHILEVGNIGNLWSLCVEEQFYLIWPAVVWWVRDRRRLMYVCAIVSAFTVCGRFYLYMHAPKIEIEHGLIFWSTYTRCDTLLVGAFLALYLRGNALSQMQLRRASTVLFIIPAAILAIGTYVWRAKPFFQGPFTETAGYSLIALSAAGVLSLALDDDSWLARLLRNRPLSALGTISYGFYFFHSIPSNLWRHLAGMHPRLQNFVPFMAFIVTLTVTWLSFQFWERPFLGLKAKLAPQRQHIHVSEPRPERIL